MIGSIVRIFMLSGNIYQGVVRQWSEEDGILLVNANGEHFKILATQYIESFSYIPSKKDNEPIKERDSNDDIPTHKIGDVESLVELQKMKAQEELAEYKRKLTSNTISTPEVRYGDQFSVLRQASMHSGKQNIRKKK